MESSNQLTIQTLAADLQRTGDVGRDVTAFLTRRGLEKVARHCGAVAQQAESISHRFGANAAQAVTAAWLHDVGLVWPRSQRLTAAEALGLDVLDEERALPTILHQKLSVVLAQALFEVKEPAILRAVACHTTLRPNSSLLDKVVFVADKLTWEPEAAPWQDAMAAALEHSLDDAAAVYLDYMWGRRDRLPIIHPWLAAAYRELRQSP